MGRKAACPLHAATPHATELCRTSPLLEGLPPSTATKLALNACLAQALQPLGQGRLWGLPKHKFLLSLVSGQLVFYILIDVTH